MESKGSNYRETHGSVSPDFSGDGPIFVSSRHRTQFDKRVSESIANHQATPYQSPGLCVGCSSWALQTPAQSGRAVGFSAHFSK